MRKLTKVSVGLVAVAALVLALGGTALAMEGEHPGTTEQHQTATQHQATEQHHMFGDATGTWYEPCAELMAQNRFMMGYTNGDFGGGDPINRGQFVAIMARMMNMASADDASFSDTHGHWAEGQIAAMVKAGIITGRSDGTFGPGEHITRAQMAALMDRARQYLGLDVPTMDRDQLHQHLGDVAGHWAEDHIAHMYCLGVTTGDSTGHFRPDDDTNRAQAAAMLWRWHEAR